MSSSFPWLTALIVVPLLGAAVLWAVPAGRARAVALGVSLLELLLGVATLTAFDVADSGAVQLLEVHGWIPAFGVSYAVGVDGVGLILVLMSVLIVPLVVLAAIFFAVRASRRKKLQNTFGPEYDRAVADSGNRADAEKELRERERRHAELELKPLSPESTAKYSAAWEEVQIQFVDNPGEAVSTADDLTTQLIAERGYPTGDYDDQLANLSVDHARTLGHYRDAHEISRRSKDGEASTEDLRQALVHYRARFADLLGENPVRTDSTADVESPPTVPTQKINNHDSDVAGSRPDATSR